MASSLQSLQSQFLASTVGALDAALTSLENEILEPLPLPAPLLAAVASAAAKADVEAASAKREAASSEAGAVAQSARAEADALRLQLAALAASLQAERGARESSERRAFNAGERLAEVSAALESAAAEAEAAAAEAARLRATLAAAQAASAAAAAAAPPLSTPDAAFERADELAATVAAKERLLGRLGAELAGARAEAASERAAGQAHAAAAAAAGDKLAAAAAALRHRVAELEAAQRAQPAGGGDRPGRSAATGGCDGDAADKTSAPHPPCFELRARVSSLEADLDAARRATEAAGAEGARHKALAAQLEDELASAVALGAATAGACGASGGDASLLSVVCGQRDRFRARAQALEHEAAAASHRLSAAVAAADAAAAEAAALREWAAGAARGRGASADGGAGPPPADPASSAEEGFSNALRRRVRGLNCFAPRRGGSASAGGAPAATDTGRDKGRTKGDGHTGSSTGATRARIAVVTYAVIIHGLLIAAVATPCT